MADEQTIVVEVPSDRGHYSPVLIPQSNKLEEFKKGWRDAIALPDNLPDLVYTLASTVAIPALLSSCWVSIPIPGFIRLGGVGSFSDRWNCRPLLAASRARGQGYSPTPCWVGRCGGIARDMSSDLHPSQLHQHLQMYVRAKWSFWGSLTVSCGLLFLGATQKPESKPWILAASVGTLEVGRRHRQTAKLLLESLSDIDSASRLNFQAWARAKTQPTAQLALTVGAIDANWKPENLITDPVEYIQKKQKHVALVGGTGDGKSTLTQFLSSKIGGRVVVYDSDAKPDDWSWLDQKDVIGRKGNFKAIDTAMGDDLKTLEELVELRGEGGDNAIAGRERFLIAEEFPILVDECDHAATWIKRHAKRGRRYKQFICALAQNDTAENFGLQGDKDTLYSCFCLARLGQFGRDYARTKLKDPQLEQWLKAGGKRRFMVDDCPCELDLSNWGTTAIAQPETSGGGDEAVLLSQDLNEYEQIIVTLGQQNPGELLTARIVKQRCNRLKKDDPENIRIIFQSLADRGIGEVEKDGDRLGWRWSK